jgi:hypothetical protein
LAVLHGIGTALYVFAAWWGVLMAILVIALLIFEGVGKLDRLFQRIAPPSPSVDADVERLAAMSDEQDRRGRNPNTSEYAAQRNAAQAIRRQTRR